MSSRLIAAHKFINAYSVYRQIAICGPTFPWQQRGHVATDLSSRSCIATIVVAVAVVVVVDVVVVGCLELAAVDPGAKGRGLVDACASNLKIVVLSQLK